MQGQLRGESGWVADLHTGGHEYVYKKRPKYDLPKYEQVRRQLLERLNPFP